MNKEKEYVKRLEKEIEIAKQRYNCDSENSLFYGKFQAYEDALNLFYMIFKKEIK